MWIADGSSNITIEGNSAKCTAGSCNSFNAMWKEPMTEAEAYWQFKFSSLVGGGFVGLSNEDTFAAGYKVRGAFYGGNLANGCSGLVTDFGPRFESNDVVGMLVSKSGSDLEVFFDHNGKPLGQAYKFPLADLPNPFPTVLFHESGSVTCQQAPVSSAVRARPAPTFEGPAGHWRLTTMTNVTMPEHLPTMELTKTSDTAFKGIAHVINSIRFTITKSGSDTWTAAGGAMTMMAGDEAMMGFENVMVKHLQTPSMFIETNGVLTYNSPEHESTWVRYDSGPGVYQGSPLKK